jgi:uncharacterized protein YjbJ (UPF0337 family)
VTAIFALRNQARRLLCYRGTTVNTQPTLSGDIEMTGKKDEVVGRVKEAAGAITDNDDLRREGKVDQAAGKVKQAAENVVEKVKDAAHDAIKR